MPHKLIAKNTLYQLVTRIFSSSTTFLITVLIAAHFDVGGFGEITKIVAFVGLFYLLIDFGFNAIFLQKEQKDSMAFTSLLSLRLLVAFIVFCLVNVLAFFLPYNSLSGLGFSDTAKFGIFIFSFSYFSQALQLSAAALFQKRLQYSRLLLATGIGSLISLLLVVFFASQASSVSLIVLSLVCGNMATGIFSLLFSGSFASLSFSTKGLRQLFVESAPIGLMLFFNLIYFRIDIFLLSLLKSSYDVGIYGFSYRFFDFLIALPLFLSNALYPSLLLQEKNRRRSIDSIRKYLVISVLFSFLLVFVFWFLSPLISFVKPSFIEAVVPFRILLISLPAFFVTNILQWTLIAKKQQQFLFLVYLVAAVVNIVFNILLIPGGSYRASAVITGISEVFILIALLVRLILIEKNIQKENII